MRAPRWLTGWWPWGREAQGQAKAVRLLQLDQVLAAAELLVENIEKLIEMTKRRRP